MNSSYDPQLLAALLDGELDPESRARAEFAVRSDPASADCLADLVRVRDAVASLPMTTPGVDLSSQVVATLRHRRRVGHLRLAAMATVAAGLAASVMVMVQMGWWRERLEGPIADSLVAPSILARKPIELRPSLGVVARSARPVAMVPSVAVAVRPETLAAEVQVRDDRRTLQSLIAQGEPLRVDLVVDELGPAIEAMDAVVADSQRSRPRHAKVHMVNGVDPKRPGKVCVYVLVMDGFEYNQFRDRLDDHFENVVIKSKVASPDLLASLGSVGRIEVLAGGPPTGVLMPRQLGDMANIARRVPEQDTPHEVVVDGDGNIVRTVPERRRDPAPKIAKRRDPEADSTTHVYLVWLSPRERVHD